MKFITSLLILITFFSSINAQMIMKPSVGVKTHPTLSIIKIDLKPNETVFYMSIVNRIREGGWFCVDKNVILKSEYLKNDLKMIRSENIANCPTSHQFKQINESVNFRLVFPPLPEGVKEVDLVEDCTDNCFSITGIVLDPVLNEEIKTFDKGFSLYSKNDFKGSLPYFIKIRDNSLFKDMKQFGYSVYIIPVIYYKLGENEAAKTAFRNLKDLDFKDKDYFIDQLKKIEFFKNLK